MYRIERRDANTPNGGSLPAERPRPLPPGKAGPLNCPGATSHLAARAMRSMPRGSTGRTGRKVGRGLDRRRDFVSIAANYLRLRCPSLASNARIGSVPGLVPPAPRTPTIGNPRIRRGSPPPAPFTGRGSAGALSTSRMIRVSCSASLTRSAGLKRGSGLGTRPA
jgi:hypothetical protein